MNISILVSVKYIYVCFIHLCIIFIYLSIYLLPLYAAKRMKCVQKVLSKYRGQGTVAGKVQMQQFIIHKLVVKMFFSATCFLCALEKIVKSPNNFGDI